MTKRFEDKVVLITGGTGDIGSTTARLFLEEGAKVALVGRSEEKLGKVKEELGDVFTLKADVTEEAEVKKYVEDTVKEFGKIDVFFNNAGTEGKMGLIKDQSLENFENVLRVNVIGVFLGLKYVIPVMEKQGYGSIINTASIGGLVGSPNNSPYVTSKHGIEGITKSAALEVADKGIRVNTVNPTFVEGRMMRSIESGMSPEDSEAARSEMRKLVPMGRYATPEDIAKAVLFLGSDDAGFITGTNHRVDGGTLTSF